MKAVPSIPGMVQHVDIQRDFEAALRRSRAMCPQGCDDGHIIRHFAELVRQRNLTTCPPRARPVR